MSDENSSLKNEYNWMNTTEAAALLRVSVKALRNMTSNGFIPYYKLGSRNRYRREDLEALLLSQKRGRGAQNEDD
jgi:excisionase family DNA binding protein